MVSESAVMVLTLGIFGGALCYLIMISYGFLGTVAFGILGLLISAYIINEVVTRMDTIISLMQGEEEEIAEHE